MSTRRRALLIEEQFGLYRVRRGDEVLGTGTTLERALERATLGQAPAEAVFKTSEVIGSLLGEQVAESELVTG